MGTPANPVTPTTPKKVLDALAQAGGYIGVAVQLGELIVPIGKALVSKIKDIASGNVTITYQLMISEDQAELNDVDAMSTADLTAINAELTRLGKPTLPVPGS